MDEQKRLEIEAATFRRVRDYLQEHTEVQNIDLMNLAGFCRNCISKWYRAEAEALGETIDYDQARELVYGMPYGDWKRKYQVEATDAQKAEYAERQSRSESE